MAPLSRGSETGPDDPDARGGLSVNDEEKPFTLGHPQDNKAILLIRVLIVRERGRERIGEGRHGFGEADTVLAEVGGSFARIELEGDLHAPDRAVSSEKCQNTGLIRP